MYFHKDKKRKVGGYWRCRERRKIADAKRYYTLPGVQYQKYLLQRRRKRALDRVYQRAKERAVDVG